MKRVKRDIRRRILAARESMDPNERGRYSEAITERLISLEEMRTARTVMLYWSFGSEFDTSLAIARSVEDGKRVALPRIVEGDIEARTWHPGEPLTSTGFGAKEPAGGEHVPPSDLDLVVTPGVAFDTLGYRIGYGGGYYDRFFAELPAERPRVAACFEQQVVPDPLPHGHFDRAVDVLVTPDRVIRPRRDP